jgi:CBS domain containing-hemolysin-like protein
VNEITDRSGIPTPKRQQNLARNRQTEDTILKLSFFIILIKMLTSSALQAIEIEVTETLLRFAVLIALTLAIAFFVAAELSLVSASREKIYRLAQSETETNQHKAAEQVYTAQTQIEHFLSVTQTGTTAGSLLLGWLGEGATVHWIEPWIQLLPIGRLPAMLTAHSISVAVAFFLVTYIEIVLGELVPKVIAANAPEETILVLIRPLQLCAYLFAPLLFILNGTVRLLTLRLTRKVNLFELPPSQVSLIQTDAHSLSIPATIAIEALNQELGLTLPTSNAYKTLAGFMIHHLGRVPTQNEHMLWGDLELEATQIIEGNLQTILLRRVTAPLFLLPTQKIFAEE